MTELWPEVSEEQANEREALREVYEDIRATLRVRFVPWPFRVLASYPSFPHLWRELAPTITSQLEEAADRVRDRAVTHLLEAGQGSDHRAHLRSAGLSEDGIAQILDQLQVYHYLDPKLLLLFVALEEALAGRPVGVKSIVVWPTGRGAPPFMPRPERVDPAEASGEVARTFQEIQDKMELRTVSDEYRTLARWPEYLSYAWGEIRELSETSPYGEAVRGVEAEAIEAVRELRRRMEVRPEDLERLGVGEAERKEVYERVAAMRRALSPLVVQTAYLVLGLGGPEEARLTEEALMRRWTSPRLG